LGYTLSTPCLSVLKDTSNHSALRINDAALYIIDALKNKGGLFINPAVLTAINNIGTQLIVKTNTSTTESGCDPMAFQSLNIKVQYNPTKDKTLNVNLSNTGPSQVSSTSKLFLSRKSIPLCELDYFEAMNKDDKIALYSNLKERLNYFHPAFHSTTPEGFNSRLTFLLQCTRQGPSIQKTADSPSNMAFGRPPVCVLKIGDFYHTKVVIDSVNISYDDNTWDLNPEGIGIQPMIATVDLNMKMVGGSSLAGPISELQNALSYHFFANTEVYMGDKFMDGKIQEPIIPPDPVIIPKKAAVILKEETKPEPPVVVFGKTATYDVGLVGLNSFFIMCPFVDNGQLSQYRPKCEEYYIDKIFRTDITFSIIFNATTPSDYTVKTTIRDINGKTPNGGTVTQVVTSGSTHLYGGIIENIYLEFDTKYYLTSYIIEESNFLLVSKQVEFTESTCPDDVPLNSDCLNNPTL